jgi:hypothetical protein
MSELNIIGLLFALIGLGLTIYRLSQGGRLRPNWIMDEKKKRPAYDTDNAGVRDLLEEGREEEAVEVYQKFAGVDEYTARDAVARLKDEM